MPVILTKPDEIEMWMSAPAPEAVKLQRALSDDALRVVARGQKEDGPQVTWFVPPLRVAWIVSPPPDAEPSQALLRPRLSRPR